TGRQAAVFQVRSAGGSNGPWIYTVGAGAEVHDTWDIAAGGETGYDLSVYGPNGFLRTFKGAITGNHLADLRVGASYDAKHDGIALEIRNEGEKKVDVSVTDGYSGGRFTVTLKPGEVTAEEWKLKHSYGWYDLTIETSSDSSFRQQIAGHVETGLDSITDPAIAKPQA
ncbi:MAG TPA: phospholipase domain-containing protein, partial [Acidobacteriaceae bacterium]